MPKVISIKLDEVAQLKFDALKKKHRYKDYSDFWFRMLDEQYAKIR